jgi:PAS domain S-box-containing protein
MLRLRTYLVLLVLGGSLPILAFAAYAVASFAGAEERRVEARIEDATREATASLDRELQDLIATARILAASEALETGDLAAFHRRAAEAAELWNSVVTLRDAESRQVVNTNVPWGQALPAATSLAEEDREVARTGRPVVSNLYRAQVERILTFAVVVPAVVGPERAPHFLSVAARLPRIQRILEQEITLEPGAVAGVVDRNGIFVARSAEPDRFVGRPAPNRAAETGQRAGIVRGPGAGGEASLLSYRWSEVAGWRVGISIPEVVLDAPRRRALAIMAALGACALALVLAITLLVGRRLSGAMMSLGAAADALRRKEDIAPAETPLLEANEIGASLAEAARGRNASDAALRASEAALAEEVAALRRLQAASTALVAEEGVGPVLDHLLDAAQALMRSDCASIQMLNPGGDALTLVAHRGFHPDAAAFWGSVAAGCGSSCGAALAVGGRVVVEDVETITPPPRPGDMDSWRKSGIRSVQSTPLVSRHGRLLGVISTHWGRVHRPDERAFALLDVIARQAADAIERARVAEALREGEERLRLAGEAGGVGAWDVDLATGERRWSDTACRLWGIPPGTVVTGELLLGLVHPDDRDRAAATLGRSFDTPGRPAEEEFRIHRASDNAPRTIVSRFEILADPGTSRLARQVGIFRDVTEARATQAALAEREKLLEMIAAGHPLEECLTEVTAAIGRLLPGARACVLVPDAAGAVFERTFSADVPLSFREKIHGAEVGEFAIGTCGVVVWAGRPVSCPDIAVEGPWVPEWRELCLAHGYRACHSEPAIAPDGRTLASVALYFGEARELTAAEREAAVFGARVAALALERDRQAAALLESEERHRLTVESARDYAIVTLGMDGRITGWNSGAERLMGYAAPEILGQPGAVFFTEEDRAAGVPEEELRLARDEGRAENERWHLRRDGSRFWGSGLVTPLSDGRQRGYLKVFQDRTREHEAAARLRDSEAALAAEVEALRQLQAVSTIMMQEDRVEPVLDHILQAARSVMRSDCASIQMLDVDRGELVLAGSQGFDPDSAAFWARVDAGSGSTCGAALERGERVVVADVEACGFMAGTGDLDSYRKSGIRAVQSTLLVSRSGRVLGMLSTHWRAVHAPSERDLRIFDVLARQATDVIEHARTLAALREREAEAREAQRLARIGSWRWDSATDATTGSDALFHIFGLDPADRPFPHFKEQRRVLYPAEEWDRIAAAVRHAVETGEGYALDVRAFRGTEPIWVTTRCEALRGPDGRVATLRGTVQDITERRAAEEALRQLAETLERRVAEEVATREAAQATLAHAQRMEALGQLAGGIAHDFNNVLQAVQGGARLIRGSLDEPERVRRLSGMIAEAAERGASITRRLLAFSRRSDLRAEPLDAAALLGDLREILAHTLGAGVEARVQVPPRMPPLLADKGQLETVLVNLAANARDAMAGIGAITLSAVAEQITAAQVEAEGARSATLRPGTYVRVSIADTGAGMDAATLARAAEPFFTTKKAGKGTGLGLAMARGFAEQSGGALAIESAPGQGTTVRLWLPVAHELPAGTDTPEAEAADMAVDRRAAVMLVDDEALVREITTEGLEAAGYTLLSVGSGAEALELLRAGVAVDLLVSDLSMPAMDGLAVVREAQALRPGLPAILLTGFATDAADIAFGGAISGSFTLLRKPISARLLAERIAVMLEGRAAARGGGAER